MHLRITREPHIIEYTPLTPVRVPAVVKDMHSLFAALQRFSSILSKSEGNSKKWKYTESSMMVLVLSSDKQ
jgi:hypothetical protein